MSHLLPHLFFGILADLTIERSFWRSRRECAFRIIVAVPLLLCSKCATAAAATVLA